MEDDHVPQTGHLRPDFAGRYYSAQFTDPFNINFAYVGNHSFRRGTSGPELERRLGVCAVREAHDITRMWEGVCLADLIDALR
jgi:hypothetical protein